MVEAAARSAFRGRPAVPLEGGRKWLFVLSAVLAALLCAAVVVNFIVMPIVVKRGDLVAAPDLVGRPLYEAQRVVAEVGLGLRVADERPDPAIAAGRIVRQSPTAGVDVKKGRAMTVSVSSGIDTRVVPPVSGLTQRQAELDLESAGFVVGDVVPVTSDRITRGRVIGSDPGPGAPAATGAAIRLLVSLGPRAAEFMMPSLIGCEPDEAKMIAEGLGLAVRSVIYGKSGRSRGFREVVVMQDPPPGSRVRQGEGITLRVGRS
jgi:serine/threonine-protein kinase